MAQLSRQHAELSTMMRFVSDKVVEEVNEIGRKVLPGCRRDRAATRGAESDHVDDAFAAAFQGPRQGGWFNCSGVDSPRHCDAMTSRDHLDPHAPRVVNVRGERANRATRRAGNVHGPQLSWQVLDKIHRDTVVRAPRVEQHFERDLHS